MNWQRAVVLVMLHFLSIGSAVAQPSIFWFNDPVGPDETVLVTGADLNEVTSATVARMRENGPASDVETPVTVLQANPLSLKFVIPKEFATGIYRFTLTYAGGSLAGRVNLPTIHWTRGDLGEASSPGGWIRVFGRNIVRQSNRTQLLLLPDSGTTAVKAVLTRGDLWHAAFRVPERISAGRYRLRLTNGDGGDGDWVDAGSITVRASDPKPAQSFDVRAYGAIGDGKTDCTRAIKATIDAAIQSGGGTVYFPRGRYLISETLVIPRHVGIRGERTDLVNLVWPDFASPPPALIQGTSHFSVEDMTIYASNHLHVISGGFIFRDTPAPDAGDIIIRRVRIRASAFRGQMDIDTTVQRMRDFHRILPSGAPDTIRLSGSRVEVTDCDVVGSGNSLRLFQASDAIVSGNILNNGRAGSYFLVGSRRVIFENNVVAAADLQATGGGINTLSRLVTASENIFVGGNTFKAFYGWDREGMTTDGPGGYYFGRAESISPTLLSLPDAPNPYPTSQNWAGAMVMVVNGRGAGQYGRIAASTGAAPNMSVTLDRPLQVALDPTSEVTIVQAHENYLIIDNSFEDTGVAAQIFGTGLSHVMAGNRSIRTSGFAAIGLSYGHFQPCWRIQILDNHILEGNVYRAGPDTDVYSNEALIFVRANQTATTAGRPPLVQAVIVRGNRLDQDAHIAIQGFSTASPGIRDVVVEANATGPSRVGLVVDRGVAWWLGRRNVEAPRIGR
ncbi:MAG: glycosyl hydrolase family 28-related protein [Pseudomonadota bacterium]